MEISQSLNGFYDFRVNFPSSEKSVFRNRTEIVTDGKGTILGVTNPDNLLFAKIPSSDGEVQILEVGESAFSKCTRLREISFGENLEIISGDAFKGCTALTSVSLPGSLYEIGSGAFENSGLVSFVFPPSVREVSSRCFMDSRNLRSVTLGENIMRISPLSFAGCSSLLSVDMPSCIREIPDGAFMSSGLMSIFIPHGVRRIGDLAFSGCRRMEKIFYDGTESDFRSVSFGNSWNRNLNGECTLFLKDREGGWYDAFSSGEKGGSEKREKCNPALEKALSVFSLKEVPSKKELTALFHSKAMAFHPDRMSSMELDSEIISFAQEKFREYKEAYDILIKYAK